MMKKTLTKFIPLCIVVSMMAWGCAQNKTTAPDTAVKPAAAKKQEGNVYKGKIVGKSNKAKTISIEVGKGDKAKTIMVRFDGKTKGVEHAAKGEAAIIAWEVRGSDKFATVIKPKLAKLPEGVSEIKSKELKKMIDAGTDFALVDSRPMKRYAQAHLPGAISITVPQMTKEGAKLLPPNKDTMLVFYCGGPTWGMSPKSAGLAKKAGYKNIKVLLEGEPAWTKAGYPTYASTGFVSKGNIVLIDLRSFGKSKEARIPRSVSIPSDTLGERIDDIPMKAPVVLYSDDDKEALNALKKLRGEGYKKVSLVYGNLDRWLKKDGNFESGPVVTDINWTRKLGKGEVSVEDFNKAATGKASNVVILDVRTKDEVAEGKYPSAVAIPLDELPKRTAELPKDKMIYIHCSTGARAEMAQKQLQKDGYKASFLVAEVECEKNMCEVEE